MAPSNSTISLSTNALVLPMNGTARIVARVLERTGFAPHSGTRVTFTTTLGTMSPAVAETDATGQATVTFKAGTSNGIAIIGAHSGPAATDDGGSVRITIGSSAAGRLTLSASPTFLPPTGGSSTITATVLDVNGNPLPSAPVSFSTSAGSLSASTVSTTANGVAQTILSTPMQATVTALVGMPGATTGMAGGATGSVTVNVVATPSVSIAAAGSSLISGSAVTFNLTVTPPAGGASQIRSVLVNFGDGLPNADLGAASGTLTVQHLFPFVTAPTTYTVRVTVLDTMGSTTTAATAVVIQPK
jgi:adhesin/invasin